MILGYYFGFRFSQNKHDKELFGKAGIPKPLLVFFEFHIIADFDKW